MNRGNAGPFRNLIPVRPLRIFYGILTPMRSRSWHPYEDEFSSTLPEVYIQVAEILTDILLEYPLSSIIRPFWIRGQRRNLPVTKPFH